MIATRVLRATAGPAPVLVWAFFWLQAAAQPAYALLPPRLEMAGTFLIVGSFAVFSLSHLLVTRGPRAALALLGLSAVVCGGLEALSVAAGWPFGSYEYSPRLGPGLLGVPLLIPLAWLMMAYPAWRLAELAAPRLPVVFAAAALTAWDLFLDPQMVRAGLWTWISPPGVYEGVPARNYLGWLVTALLLFGLFRPFAGRPQARLSLFGLLPVLAYAWTWVGSTLVNAIWWDRPLVALVGGLGMGGFALAGLARALEARARDGGRA